MVGGLSRFALIEKSLRANSFILALVMKEEEKKLRNSFLLVIMIKEEEKTPVIFALNSGANFFNFGP